MTQVWDKTGKRYAATVIKVWPLKVTQNKSEETDGYHAIQVGFGKQTDKNMSKPLVGHLKRVADKKEFPRTLREVQISDEDSFKVGDEIQATDVLSAGDVVIVSSTSKGHGFSGVIKRWGFHGGSRTHGQSDRQRAPGSIGQGTDPGRVHKGKKMPGRFGNQQFSIKNLSILHINQQELVLSGPIPGSKNSLITITKIRSGETPELIGWNEKNTQDITELKPTKKETTTKSEIEPAKAKESKEKKPADNKESK